MGDFDSCRFDFRIDNKSGLTPSRRKKAERRNCNYNTLFKCKTCGSLFESRPALLEHKLCHNEYSCVCCTAKFPKKSLLENHIISEHGAESLYNGYDSFVKIVPKASSPHLDDDEIITFPDSAMPPEISAYHPSASMPVFAGMMSPEKSPVANQKNDICITTVHQETNQTKSAKSDDLPSLITVAESNCKDSGTSSPSLPSSSLISAAVANVFKSVLVSSSELTNTKSTTSTVSQLHSPKNTSPAISAEVKKTIRTTSSTPHMESPQETKPPPLVSPSSLSPSQVVNMSPVQNYSQLIGAFPQVRYAFPQMIPINVPQSKSENSGVSMASSSIGSPLPMMVPPMNVTAPSSTIMSANSGEKQSSPEQNLSSPTQKDSGENLTSNLQAKCSDVNIVSNNSGSTATPINTPVTPINSSAPPMLPPGFVYINIPMMFNPSQQGNLVTPIMPQMMPILPQMIQGIPLQQQQPQPATEDQPTNDDNSSKRKLEIKVDEELASPPMKNRRKRKPHTPQCSQPNLAIKEDPKSLPSKEFEMAGSIVKIEPTAPQEIESNALDFTFKTDPHPVRCDVNFSVANTGSQEDNVLNNDNVIDLDDSDEEENMDYMDDKAAMLEQYKSELIESEIEPVEPVSSLRIEVDTNSQSSSRDSREQSTPKDFSCDQCDFKGVNGAVLSQHKAKAHKAAIKTGLNKLLGKLWENKMKKPDTDNSYTTNIINDPESEKPTPTPLEVKHDIVETDCEVVTPVLNLENKTPTSCKTSHVDDGDGFGMFKFHTCKVCKQLFDNMNALWEHMNTHKELRKFKCNMCSFKAVCRDKLNAHKQAKHPEYVKNPWSKPAVGNKKTQPQQQKNTGTAYSFHQLPIQCTMTGCEGMFTSHSELQKHLERFHATLQCPEEGCGRKFFTVGGLKNHQMSHLEENSSESAESSKLTNGPYTCNFVNCNKSFKEKRNLKAHQSVHAGDKALSCPLCKYHTKNRSSMNWHMKSKHGLDKTRTAANKTVYFDNTGNVVCGGDEGLPPVPTPGDLNTSVEEVMNHSMPDEHQRFVYNNIDGLAQTSGVISYDNEPEEIVLEDGDSALTMDKLAIHNRIENGEESDGADEQPLDMSVPKRPAQDTDAASEISCHSNQSSSLDLSQYSGEVISTLGAVPASGYLTPCRSSCSTPINLRACTLEIDSISSPSEDMSHFTSVLRFKPSTSGTKSDKKRSANNANNSPKIQTFNCKVCQASFNDAEKMWEHRIQEHGESTKFFCDTCGFDCENKEDLQNHMLSTHGKELGNFKAFICFICGKGYGTKSGLNHHMLRHSEEGPPTFPCPFSDCQSKLHSKGSLKMHIRRQHNGADPKQHKPQKMTFRCEYSGCEDLTFVKEELQQHMLSVHGKELGNFKSYQCTFCGKGYTTKQGLNNHLQQAHKHPITPVITENDRVYPCRFAGCEKSFGTSKHLKVHEMQHTGEMPLKCHLCDYACRQRNSMNWHMKSKHGLEKRVTEDGRQTYYV